MQVANWGGGARGDIPFEVHPTRQRRAPHDEMLSEGDCSGHDRDTPATPMLQSSDLSSGRTEGTRPPAAQAAIG